MARLTGAKPKWTNPDLIHVRKPRTDAKALAVILHSQAPHVVCEVLYPQTTPKQANSFAQRQKR